MGNTNHAQQQPPQAVPHHAVPPQAASIDKNKSNTSTDEQTAQMYSVLIRQGFNESIAFKAASKYPTNINQAINFLQNLKRIEIPISIECKRNAEYEGNFKLEVPYSEHDKYSLKRIMKDIMQQIHDKYYPVKFIAKAIDKDSFIGRELDDTNEDWRIWDGEFITDYSENDISNKGLKISIIIAIFEHKIKSLDLTCNEVLTNNNDDTKEELNFDPFACSIYAQMKEEYKFTEQNLLHLETFNHYRNEYVDKPKCKYGDECHTFQRMANGGNKLEDKCHIKLFRHPPRNKKVSLQSDIHSFCLNKEFSQNKSLHSPSEDDRKEYNEEDEEDGYLKALINEVVNNGFEKDLCLTYDDQQNHNHSIMYVVKDKLNCNRHKQMGSPLNKSELLAVILYTAGDSNYELCKSQRNGDYSTWKWFDYCLYWAIAKLDKREHGYYKLYTGLKGTKIDQQNIECGYFRTYVSTSWIKAVAEDFADDTGMLFEIDENFRQSSVCCDVAWISKFPDECEILIARSIDAVKNNFECRVVDNKNGMQTILLSKYSPNIIADIPSMYHRSYNIVHSDDYVHIEDNAVKYIEKQMTRIRNEQMKRDRNRLNGLDEEKKMGGLDTSDDEYLILISSEDGKPREFKISHKAVFLSNLIKSILDSDITAKKVKIKKVRGDILELVVIYLKHHNGQKPEEIAKPIRSVKMERIVADQWDADYINKMNKKTIFQVILAANYMDLPSLLHLGCAKIATLIKGKSPEEIKNILADSKQDDTDDSKQDGNEDDQ